jgi:hypothetical protein
MRYPKVVEAGGDARVDACLSEDVVAVLVSGRLSRTELVAAELHLDGCVTCRVLVAQALRPATPAPPVCADVAQIGRFRILREVGAGSMGRVYAALDPELDREVALKILRSNRRDQRDNHRVRITREARAMARLAHPNVITVHEIGAADEQIFIVMELVKGSTLRRWLSDAPRGWRAVTDVLCAAGRGLAAAHAAGIIHRDFKPANVLVGDDRRARVTDFGLAQLAANEATLSARMAEIPSDVLPITLTPSGAIVGTPAYMAPEQLRGDRADERSDLFSFCITFWEALYGERPFAGRDLAELRAAVAAGAVRPPSEGHDVPAALRDTVRRGLQPAPDDRPASMTQLLGAIETAAAIDPRHADWPDYATGPLERGRRAEADACLARSDRALRRPRFRCDALAPAHAARRVRLFDGDADEPARRRAHAHDAAAEPDVRAVPDLRTRGLRGHGAGGGRGRIE